MGLLDWINGLKNDIGSVVGGVEHAIGTGVQDVEQFFHLAPPPGAQSPQQAQTGADVGSALGYGPPAPTAAQTALQLASKPAAPPAPAPNPAAQLNAYIQNIADVGPKAVATPIAKPDFAQGGSAEGPSNNPVMATVNGILQTVGQLYPVGLPVQVANAATDIGDATRTAGVTGQPTPNPLTEAAKFGVRSTLGGPAQIFGGLANEYVQRAGLPGADASSNPLFGDTPSITEQVQTNGVGSTILNNLLNVASTALMAEGPKKAAEVGPSVGDVTKVTADQIAGAYKSLGQDGYIKIPGAENFTPTQYRAAIKQSIMNEMIHYAENPINTRLNDNGAAKQVVAQKLAMFKEFKKNPDGFIDKYQLLPPALRETPPAPKAKGLSVATPPSAATRAGTKTSPSQPAPQPGITPEGLQWAKDNGFAAPTDTLGMNKDSLTPEGVTPAQLDHAPKGEHAGNSKSAVLGRVQELHEPVPVRAIPRTPLLSDQHLDVPGKAPIDTKAPTIKLAPPKTENGLVKSFGAIKTIIGRQGVAGKELASRIVNVRETHRQLGQAFKDSIPTVLQLKKGGEFKNFVDTVEGRGTPQNPKVAQAVSEWQATVKAVEARANQAGISMGHIEDYFPHMYDNKLFTDKKTFTAAAEHLVNTGQATDLQNAVQQINDMREPWQGGHRFGNLEKARNANIPGYKMDKGVTLRYLDRAARRIAEVEQFGRDNGHVDNLIGHIAKEGKDANAAQEAFNSYWQRPADGAIAKAAEGVRKVSNVLTLSKAAISHMTQTANTGIVTGNFRTANAWLRSLSPATRTRIRSLGINYDGHAGPRISGTAPLLKQVRAQNRIVSALAGERYGEALAKAGKVDELKNKWGVQGEIGKTLTDSQRTHMAHAMADATQFSDDPADLPMWARTPTGKIVGQYRMSYQYKQGGFLFDNIVKEAGHGNLVPLLRATAVVPLAGAAVVEAKHLLGNKATPTSDPIATLEAGGAGTIPTSIADSFKYMYDGKSAVEGIAGDIAPVAGQAAQTAYNINDAVNGNTKPIGKQVLSYIPFVGNLVKNAVYPTTPADPNAIAYVQNMDAARKTLNSTTDQGVFDALYGSNKDSAGNKIPSSYDPNNSPFVAEALLSHPEVLKAATQFYQAYNQQTGQAIDPLYKLTPDQQIAALNIRAASAFPGELSGDKKQLATQLPADWQAQQDAYYKAVSDSLAAAGKGGTQPGQIPYPTPSAQVQANLDAGNTKDPGVQAWLQQLDQYNNQKRAAMGLPQIAQYGFGPSTGQIPNPSNPYAKKLAAGTTANPTFASSGSGGGSGGGRKTGAGSRGGKLKIAKGSAPKSIKMPGLKIAKAPGVKGAKLPKVATLKVAKAPRLKIAKSPAIKRAKLA